MTSPSETGALHRLHPASLIFSLGEVLRQIALLLFFAFITARGAGWEVMLAILLLPTALTALIRYLSFGYRFAPQELIVHQGLLARRARHIPYRRIQNIEQRQGPLHRLLGVVELRLQTGGGKEPEATLKVLSLAAAEQLRTQLASARPAEPLVAPSPERTLVALSLADLVRHGLLHGRSLWLLGVAWGASWQWSDQFGFDLTRWIERRIEALPGEVPSYFAALLGALLLLALVIVALRLATIAWTLWNWFDFRLTIDGELLRTSRGLVSRYAATIPRRRIQVLTVRAGLFERWLGYATVQVETAGGFSQDDTRAVLPALAPIVRAERVPELIAEVLPGVSLQHAAWQPVDARAVVRLRRRNVVIGGALAVTGAVLGGVWGALPGSIWIALSWSFAPRQIAARRFALQGESIVMESGLWTRQTDIVRFDRVQVVRLDQSPFDRRWRMNDLAVDTAGQGRRGSHLAIRYLPERVAAALYELLQGGAARTALRW